jgi:hypothetical protein
MTIDSITLSSDIFNISNIAGLVMAVCPKAGGERATVLGINRRPFFSIRRIVGAFFFAASARREEFEHRANKHRAITFERRGAAMRVPMPARRKI